MPVLTALDVTEFRTHGSLFRSVARPATGAEQLCCWQLVVEPGTLGVPHRPSREETLLIQSGTVTVTLDGERTVARPGDVVLVPAGAEFTLDPGAERVEAWVTTTVGLTATTADGHTINPPWAN